MRYFFAIIIIIVFFSASAQNRGSVFDDFYFGGGLGFNAGGDFLTYSLSPIVGYKITQRLSAGVGINYQHTGYRSIDLKLNHWGGSIFSRFMVTQQFFATTEYEYLTIEYLTNPQDLSQTARKGFSSYFLGAGFVQPLGRIASFSATGLYNFLWKDAASSPYNSPWVFRAGINVGF